MLSRPLRAFVLMLIVAVSYQLAVLLAQHTEANVLLRTLHLMQHGQGFTMGWTAGCVATGEVGLLLCTVAVITVVTWPAPIMPIAFALVAGGLVGRGIRAFIRSHHDQPVPGPRPSA